MIVVGAGLAGCEAAYQLAKRGIKVKLYDMKPKKMSAAHKSTDFAELVCSNSLKGNSIDNACGLMKEEMRLLDSVIIRSADEVSVPAGGALAVDRERFSALVTKKIKENENIEIISEEIEKIPSDDVVIIATGPLTDGDLMEDIKKLTGGALSFYDAAAPLINADSINMERAYFKSRYDKGTADYINCPMTKEEYEAFYEELINAESAPLHEDIEKPSVFEGCMPVEIMAKRGKDTLVFGPLKPVGLENPVTGERYHAVVQLRRDNAEGTVYNMVGFQTNLKFGEQKRVFSMIGGLENAEFLRYGVMHRNTFLCAPEVLCADYSLKNNENLFFAGQITGVEGYVESALSGLIAGINAYLRVTKSREHFILPPSTMCGALGHYIVESEAKHFQPVNANFGILSHNHKKVRNKKEKYALAAQDALECIKNEISLKKDLLF